MESKQGDLRPLFDANNILYEDQPPLSVSTAKQLKEYIPSGAAEWELGVDPIRILVPTGQAFVDPKASYLSFDVEFKTGEAALSTLLPCLPANASWASLFSLITTTHSSGVEVDRQRDSGVWEQIRSNYDRSKPWRDTQAANLMNQDSDQAGIVTLGNPSSLIYQRECDLSSRRLNAKLPDPLPRPETHHFHTLIPGFQDEHGYYGLKPSSIGVSDVKPHVVIPMSELVRCWDSDKLIPPQLAAGMILDLETYSKEVFFILTAGDWIATDKVLIKNLRLNVMTYTMTDSVERAVAEMSISSGLSWNWKAVHSMTTNTSGTEFSMQVSSALSRVDMMCLKSRTRDNVYGSTAYRTDSFSSNLMLDDLVYNAVKADVPDVDEPIMPIRTNQGRCEAIQCQIGSMYLPSQPIAGTQKLFQSTIEAFRAFRRHDPVSVPLTLYTGRTAHIRDVVGNLYPITDRYLTSSIGVVAIGFSSSPDLPESGLSISPQRTALVNVKFTNEKAVDRIYNLFLVHSKSCELRADSVRVFS